MTRLSARPRPRAFTVLEILVAATIFSIVSVVVLMVFRSAVRSQERSVRESDSMQRARFAMDSIKRDLNNVFFRDETSYNVAITRLLEQMEIERARAEAEGSWTDFERLFGTGDPDKDEESEPAIGNPYEKGRMIDLQMVGTNSGESDSLVLSVRTPLVEGAPYRPFGVSRVTWQVVEGALIRRTETIDTEKRNLDGSSIFKTDPPEVAKIAEGVEEFNLSYAFWYDNDWYETDAWNSAQRQVRNPRFIVGGFGSGSSRRDEGNSALMPGDPGWNEYLNDLDSEPLDRLPAYVRVMLRLKDVKSERPMGAFEAIIRMPGAVETYVPSGDVGVDIRDDERGAREEKYLRVFPGAMEKDQ